VLPLEGLIDIAAERARLSKDRDKQVVEAKKMRQKLDNADFVSRAKEEVVTENRERLASFESEIARLQAALDRLE
jgi:valyl-tRNA synthetase